MSNDFSGINALFKNKFGQKVEDAAYEVKPFFIQNVHQTKISKTYSIPVDLMPGHSLTHSKDPDVRVTYKKYYPPELKNAEGKLVAKYFKIEVPLGIVEALNKHGNKEDSLAYETATYFIRNSIRNNLLLAELSFMYGEVGFPKVVATSDQYQSKTVTAKQLVLDIDRKSTSDAAVMGLLNSPIKLIYDSSGSKTATTNTEALRVRDADYTNNKILVESDVAADIAALKLASPSATTPAQIVAYTQHGNDMLGLYQLLKNKGVVQGIDGNKYSGWRPLNHDCKNKRLTVETVKKTASTLITLGGMFNKNMTLYVSQDTWDKLSEEVDSLRQLDASYNSDKNVLGQQKVGIIHSNGAINIVHHPLVKRNMAFLMSDIKNKDNLKMLVIDKWMSFENNKQFTASETSSAAYAIGKMYFHPFMPNRKRHLLIENIDNT